MSNGEKTLLTIMFTKIFGPDHMYAHRAYRHFVHGMTAWWGWQTRVNAAGEVVVLPTGRFRCEECDAEVAMDADDPSAILAVVDSAPDPDRDYDMKGLLICENCDERCADTHRLVTVPLFYKVL